MTFQVLVEGHGLSGPHELHIDPGGADICTIHYSPTMVGETTGRLVANSGP